MSPHFEALLLEFDKQHPWLRLIPWEPERMVTRYGTASHGERLILSFLLGVWNPGTKWRGVKRFDLFEAGHVLSREALGIIARWTADPHFP